MVKASKKVGFKAAQRHRKGQQKKKTQQQLAQKMGISSPLRAVIKKQPKASLRELLVQAKVSAQQAIAETQVPLCVFFSFSDAAERAQVVHFKGQTFEHIWQQLNAWQQRAFKKSPSIRWLRIDWVTGQETICWQALPQRLNAHKRNYFRYGIALDTDFRQVFLEQELNANAMLYPPGDTSQAGLNHANFVRYAQQRYNKSFQLPDDPEQAICLFTTEALFFQPEQPPVTINGYKGGSEGRDSGRRSIQMLDATQVENLISQSSQFLAEQVNNKGRFVYGIHPCFDREIKTYNTLRHASTTYSMLEAWEITQSTELKSAIDRALYLLTEELIRRYTSDTGETLAYLQDQNNEIKLGGNAVCLLALVKYTELTEDTCYLPLLEQLALGILKMQDSDTGQFTHVLNAQDLSAKEVFRIIYYDGEAAFGLMRLYGLTKDQRWLNTVVKAFDYFIAQKHWQIHDHWLSYCVNELTLYRPEERYFQFGIWNVAGHLDFVIERITTFPTLLELMMAAHKMILRLQQSDTHRHLLKSLDLDKFYRALETRAHYLLNGFFWPEMAMFFKNPQRILGSFFIRHHSFRVRIDDVEHYLSGFVAYLRHYLPAPYRFSSVKNIADERPLYWDQQHVALAAKGRWQKMPQQAWRATGLSIAAVSMQPGHMVAVKGEQPGGIPAQLLHRLSSQPSAFIVEESFLKDDAGLVDVLGVAPVYQVASVRDAIIDFGAYARKQFTGKVIGITGSAGKTSSVQLVQQLLRYYGETDASRLSANLPHGIAWNLASMDWQADFHVVEMAVGRMSGNSKLVQPDVAVFLNVGPAHLEYHRSTQEIAVKKSRIFEAMQPGRYAVINRDMQEWPVVEQAARHKRLNILTFGTHPDSTLSWLNPSPVVSSEGAVIRVGTEKYILPLNGQGAHTVMNTLAALGVLYALDLPYTDIIPHLAQIKPTEGRGQQWQIPVGSGNVTLVDDAYNANPLSMKAMLDQVGARQVSGKKHLILADMLELGPESMEYHRALIPQLNQVQAASLILLGDQMHQLADALDTSSCRVFCADDHEQVRQQISKCLQPGDLVVAKGSNKFKLSELLKTII